MKNLMLLILLLFISFNSFALDYGQPRRPWGLAVSENKINVANVARGFVSRSTVGTTFQTTWAENVDYVFPPSASVMTVSSSDALDTSAGIGLQQVEIFGLDLNYEPISEIITLQGQAPQTTINSYLRIQGNGLVGKVVGSNNFNLGKIYIGTGAVAVGVPAVIYNSIEIGQNASQSGFFTVPNKQSGYMVSINSSVEGNKFVELDVWGRIDGIFRKVYGFHVNGQALNTSFQYPDRFPEKTDVDVRAKTDVGTASVKSIFHMVLIK